MPKILTPDETNLDLAAQYIQEGNILAFPTETVYGLGADARNGRAVAKIFSAKNRPGFNPLIVHVASLEEAEKLVVFNEKARALAQSFWPGPLSIILPQRADNGINELVSAGLGTLAIRIPSHPVALNLLRKSGCPIAAPSANASGEPSATTPMHVADSLKENVPYILAGGAAKVGLESTVIDLSGDMPVLARPGSITLEELEEVICTVGLQAPSPEKPVSPGQLLKHYAPSIPVRLRAVDIAPDEALLAFGSTKFMSVRGGGSVKNLPDTQCLNLSPSGDLHEAAANLFRMLRDLDQPAHSGIAVMDIPRTGIGVAIWDRLERAARGR
jgi:L-threonylcarbamoyladenylate synthase